MKRLVLLGGGHAHVHVLRSLALEPLAGTEVVLVTPFLRQMYSGMVPGLVAGHYTAGQCAIPLAPLARAAGVRLIEGAAVGLDAAARRVPLVGGDVTVLRTLCGCAEAGLAEALDCPCPDGTAPAVLADGDAGGVVLALAPPLSAAATSATSPAAMSTCCFALGSTSFARSL